MDNREYDQLDALSSSSNTEISRLSVIIKDLRKRVESLERNQTDLMDKINALERENIGQQDLTFISNMRQRGAFTAGARFHSYHITKNKRYDCKPLICQVLEFQLGMALGEKLFEESGNVTGFKVTKVHPTEGVTMEVSFASEITGTGRFPSGKNIGSGTMTQYPHGIVDQSDQGSMMTNEGDQFVWWAHGKSKVIEGRRVKGLIIVSGFTNSQKLSWMNSLVMALESEFDPESKKFKITGYEWK